MTRRTLITAITATGLLWAGTVVMAVTEAGSDRLHETLLVGSFLAGIVTLALAGTVWADSRLRATSDWADKRIQAVTDELHDGVRQAADELHEAVDLQGKTLRDDRIAAVHTLTAELQQARDDKAA